jgi:hypothetical protein
MTSAGHDVTWLEWVTEACGDATSANALVPQDRVALAWMPVEQDIKLAWVLYNELRTRITTQRLPIGYGDEGSALRSLVEFFRIARAALAQHTGAMHASALMTHSLNGPLRQFTAAWHTKSESGELLSLDQRYLFRRDLSRLQKYLSSLTSVFAALVGDVRWRGTHDGQLLAPEKRLGHQLGTGLKYGIPAVGVWADQIRDVNEAEARLIDARRLNNPTLASSEVVDAVGLAISGGGLRSATFALGIVQELARRGVMKDVDVMSTVSGGGYIGSFLTCLLSDPSTSVGLAPGQQPFGNARTAESAPIRHIRNHSKYLAEGGMSTAAHVVFLILYGIAMSLLLAAPAVLIAAFIAIYGFGIGGTHRAVVPQSAFVWVRAVGWMGLLVSATLLSVVRLPSWRRGLERAAVFFFLYVLSTQALRVFPAAYVLFAGRQVPLFLASGLVPLVLATAGVWLGESRRLGRAALMCLALFGPLFFFCAWVLAIELLSNLSVLSAALIVVAAVLYGWFFVNVNFTSLHGYYRGRLIRTFLRRVDNTAPPDPLLLSKLNANAKAPLHLLCASLNVPASKSDELRGRMADLFTFSSLYCGGPLVGWRRTTEWEQADPYLDLGTAMAISGAAAAPRMGSLTSIRYTALLALLNVRLGYWLAKPGRTRWWRQIPGGLHLLREITGRMDEDLSFINLSDGGHVENSGIYELLRRRCRYIVAIDGEADPEHSFGGLLNAIRMANIDLGVTISPDLSDLRDGIEPFRRAHFVMTRIFYPAPDGAAPIEGLLFVFKLALTGNESELLLRFRQQYPRFPHQSTFEQVFSEAQFEAYRELGQHAADAAFDDALLGRDFVGAVGWLRCLETSLLARV